MNSNNQNINLTWEISISQIIFLYLEVNIYASGLYTQMYFKETDRNSYISITSCHYKPWIANISRGQYMRIRRNYRLTKMYMDMGYKVAFLAKERDKIRDLESENLLVGKP